jgi:hypothetical protein
MTRHALLLTLAPAFVACAVGTYGNGKGTGNNESSDGGFTLNNNNNGQSGGAALIYAHSDTELYAFDPSALTMTDVGPFDDGSGSTPTITDLAVNANGDVWVNSETAIYHATVPSSGGNVSLSLVANIAGSSGQKFYALGFAPAGVLGSAETLVAGDSLGVLYAIETTGAVTELGSFGSSSSGDVYELSGDVMFYLDNGTPRGLATVRSCSKSGSCDDSNDILAEIDVSAMSSAYQSKSPATSLKKQFLGNGTGYGRLFGVGAWNNQVFAFSRESGSTPAQLVAIDGTGNGTVVQTFGQITSGWSGAGVTTNAKVTVLPN